MSNTFITPTMVARDAAIALEDRLIVGNALSRDKEGLFKASKVGDEIKVTVPPAVSNASEFSSSTSATDQTETEVPVTLEKHFYKRVDLTSKQKSLELSDFTRLVTMPNVQGIAESIDKFFLRNMQVFRKNLTGTVGNRPSTIAHVAAARKTLKDQKVGGNVFNALVDTTVESSLSQLANFASFDYGQDASGRTGGLGMRYGLNFVTDANLGAFSRSAAAGDITGTPVIYATVGSGGTEISVDGVTNATGTIYAGTVFTIAGHTSRYVVRKDVTAVGNKYTDILITPALEAEATAEDALTFEAAGYSNLVYAPAAVVGCVVAPEPLAANSVVQSFQGVSMRVSMDSSITTLADSIVYDVFVGCRVVQPDGGALFCG